MANVIATLLTAPKTINVSADAKGPPRHSYNELLDLQAVGDPALASPYLLASGVESIAAAAASSGNFTITVAFPVQGVEVTTTNILHSDVEATIQTAVDTALSGAEILATYVADDVKVELTGTVSANAATVTANGTTVNGARMVVTTTNVDLDVAAPAVTTTTEGTQNRPAEAVLALFGALTPAGTVTPQGDTPAEADYATGDNPMSISPSLKGTLISEIEVSENGILGTFLRAINDSVR